MSHVVFRLPGVDEPRRPNGFKEKFYSSDNRAGSPHYPPDLTPIRINTSLDQMNDYCCRPLRAAVQRSFPSDFQEQYPPLSRLLGVMNPSSSFAEAARRAFDNLSLELQKSTEDDNLTEELEEFLKIMGNNDVDDDDDIIELANYLTEVKFSTFYVAIVGNLPPQEIIRKFDYKE